ncbi:Re/Si-specific NAD(P)(+) transhydrogenase subunit alpha [Elioraea rosea]|uniref:Re/Si-specific NAD(P)(+) transhydrogenase subunit alpha n=1 Tax=Elioraea rosea TaxID=2492390 RepID=UPI001182DBF7|nr:Re/Si-specific NAD(P)(+) transhydrogenase subunit alpha [Elioraea rosea]
MRLAVLKERRPGEARVAATPDTVKKLTALGLTVVVESGAGAGSSIPDSEFAAAGAEIAPDAAAALSGAGIVFKVQAPLGPGEGDVDEMALIPRGALLVGTLGAYGNEDRTRAYAERGIDACAMELLPRITRAQSMDVLSSQANLAGYRAVLEGATAYGRGFPMMMTAAGTVPPAAVFVLGAGVAGLQAIATARRLGAKVSATDVRPAAKEEIKSLGAAFIGVESEETAAAQTSGGYAKEMSEDFKRRQAELMAETVKKQDIIVCTALTLGRAAPKILSAEHVASMKPGAVIVDIAADAGGNCALTVPGEKVVTENDVTILGWRNWPSRIAVASSALYARNLLTFLTAFWDKDGKKPNLKPEDEIVQGVALTRGGAVVHPAFAPKPAAAA